MKKRTYILIAIFIFVLMALVFVLNQENFKKQIARYYYVQATEHLNRLDNKKSTEALLHALDWDTEIGSKEYQDFQKHRSELLDSEENQKKYLETR